MHTLLNVKDCSLDPTIIDQLKVWLPCVPLRNVPFHGQAEGRSAVYDNRKAVGMDELLAELLQFDLNGDADILARFRFVVAAVWKGAESFRSGSMPLSRCSTKRKTEKSAATTEEFLR